MTIFGFEIPASALTLGVITGFVYGLLAVGIVLVYRATRVINFAHGQIGAFAAAVMGVIATRAHIPYWISLVLSLVVGAAVAALTEMLVVRRLAKAPQVMTIVALLGVADFLLGMGGAVNNQSSVGAAFPKPPGFPSFSVGALEVDQASTAILCLSPVVVIGLAIFFRRSRFGVAIRAAASNPKAAELAGVSVRSMGTLAWSIAGALSAFTAILVLPTRGFTAAAAFGPSLLLRALIGAVLARMVSLPIAMLGGISVGIVEALMEWNYPRSGGTELVLFLILLVALLLQRRGGTRERERGSYVAVQPWRPLPEALRQLPAVRRLAGSLIVVSVAIAGLLPLVVTNTAAITLAGVVSFALVGLSIVLLAGDGGQISLGQFGIAALGGVVSYRVVDATANYAVSFLAAGLAAAVIAILVGLPALRIRGLMLAVTTLAFAEAAQEWFLKRPEALGSGVQPNRPEFGHYSFGDSRRYYFFCLLVLVIGMVLVRNFRGSGLGRQLRAVRDNEDAARAFTVRATRIKLTAFATAGFVAGLGGALYVHSLSFVDPSAFPLSASVNIVALSALGGIGLLGGPILGALYIIALPAFVDLDSAGIAATSLGWLVLVLFFPGGLAQVVGPLRERLVDFLARRAGLDPVEIRAERGAGGQGQRKSFSDVQLSSTHEDTSSRGGTVLDVSSLTKRFGALVAVDGVSLQVEEGEILGIIGPNGAGKTTFFEMLSGFTKPETGRIRYGDQDITAWSPEARGRAGLIRSFQDGALFSTLTVQETLQLAFERTQPTRFVPAILGLRRQDRDKKRQAEELLQLLGLESYRSHQIGELSTGTRRIVELGSLVALRPRVLLLDEPTSGIAQRESEALGKVLLTIKEHLNATLILIEHDMPLIMGLSDRILAMSAGRELITGTPAEVKANREVIDSYLGMDGEDSAAAADDRCIATTAKGTRCTRKSSVEQHCSAHHRALVGAGR